ncbi:crotonase/enoyl-CoA hydratase family protein [Novosphingobium colocasiae]|uniref:crotonase/enoyl-CoA hydratase family protein n=1 Tax=Novosphingobium colocasiae TaxID=1256513 RepID=UPI0035B45C89
MEGPVTELVRYDNRDGIVTLTLDDPATRNAISGMEMVEAILAALARLEADDTARVAILTGAGPVFSSGGNVKAMGEAGGLNDPLPARTRRNYKRGIQRLPLTFAALEVPVIAAVNGAAIGAGCDLACMCELRVAATSARFAESFVKLGLIAGDGGAWLLPRVIGFSRACEMALTGDAIDAQTALEWGLVSRVVGDEDLMPTARELAGRIAANPPFAVRMTKRLLWEAQSASLANVLEMAAAMQAVNHATADHKEAIAAFLDRRPPRFTGD